jgi:hypothetical protein
VTTDQIFEYARDDFNYPRFFQNILKKALNFAIAKVQEEKVEASTLTKVRYVVGLSGMFALVLGLYLWTSIFITIWLFLDQVNLHLFVDRTVPSSRFKHFVEEVPLMVALSLHMWVEGHFMTGVAGLVGITGLYLLTNLQMKYDLSAINLPRLYFLRWDRMGIMFLFTLLGAWPGERAYLFVVLLAWFLAALSFYDYIWILIQLAKKKK